MKETPSPSDEQQDLVLEIPSRALEDDQGGNGMEFMEELDKAVCRICLVEVGEDRQTLRMECKCKGGLALAHRECALKWFGIKGNKTCDVCKQAVHNLPLTPLRVPSNQALAPQQHQLEDRFNRQGEYMYSLAVGHALAYFCLIEALMVREWGFLIATAASLLSSGLLGIFGSVTCSSLVWSKYVWVYAAAQFVLVVLCALFLMKTMYHCLAPVAVAFPASIGWVISICCGLIIDDVAARRKRKLKASNQQHGSEESAKEPNASLAVQIETTYLE